MMTTTSSIDKALEQSSRTDMAVLISVKEKAKRRVLNDATPANLAALDRATRMLEAHQMNKKLKEAKEALSAPDRFKTKAAVLQYLKDQGWDIEKQTFYNHSNPKHRDGGKLNKVGRYFLRTHVEAYAVKYLVKLDGSDSLADEQGGLQFEKLQAETEYRKIQAQKARFDLDVSMGKYIPVEQLDLEFAGRAGVLDASFRHLVQSRAPEFVALVAGKQDKIPDLVSSLLEYWDQMLSEFASNKEFQVIIKPKQGGE